MISRLAPGRRALTLLKIPFLGARLSTEWAHLPGKPTLLAGTIYNDKAGGKGVHCHFRQLLSRNT